MTRLTLLLAASAGACVTAALWAVLKPPRRLRMRVRPYSQVARTRLLRTADPETYLSVTRGNVRLIDAVEPLIGRIARLHARVLGPRDQEVWTIRLRNSGLYPALDANQRVEAFRRRSLATSLAGAALLGLLGWSTNGAVGMIAYSAGGFALGAFLARGRVSNAVVARRRLIRAELYTVNQILAMRARAGGGVTDALRHVAQRSRGVVASEIRETLQLQRNGIPITDALRRAAATTAEPEAGRLYLSLAIAHERGVDLADTLVALAADLRVRRRDEAVTKAAGRRIAAVIPIVVILAPIALAFLAAPLPTLIFGNLTP
jgi:Flp pilus assembly protein TadB